MGIRKLSLRDFKWFFGLFIGMLIIFIMVLVGVIYFKLSGDKESANIIMLASGLVSIILGAIAIIYAFYQTRYSALKNNELHETLRKIDKSVNTLSELSNNIDEVKYLIDDFKYSSDYKFDNIVSILNFKDSVEYKNLENKEIKEELDMYYEELHEVLDHLKPKEYIIMSMRFGINCKSPMTVGEITRELNKGTEDLYTIDQIIQIEKKTYQKLGEIFLRVKSEKIQAMLKL